MKSRFPKFHFSQIGVRAETPAPTDICMAIPRGAKYYVWMTFKDTDDVCVFMNARTGEYFYEKIVYSPLCWGTVFYGTLLRAGREFVIENVFWFQGRATDRCTVLEKLTLIRDMFRDGGAAAAALPKQTKLTIAKIWYGVAAAAPPNTYQILVISRAAAPPPPPKARPQSTVAPPPPPTQTQKNPKCTAAAPPQQQKQNNNKNRPLVAGEEREFYVRAGIGFDIYYLYPSHAAAVAENAQKLLAHIPDYRTSIFMNSMFRKICADGGVFQSVVDVGNGNKIPLDYIEESDDEEEFENINCDKYVKLDVIQKIKCKYSTKFRKWCPISVAAARQ